MGRNLKGPSSATSVLTCIRGQGNPRPAAANRGHKSVSPSLPLESILSPPSEMRTTVIRVTEKTDPGMETGP
jgi:hypothetical protein